MATLLGFIICSLLLRSKKYKLGWLTAFYGIYYGIARLLIEGMRTDSLYLWIGSTQTDIKISQLVSIFTMALGAVTLLRIYRKDALYSKLFKTPSHLVAKTRWVLLGIATALVGVSIFAYIKGGESMFILGFACDVVALYALGAMFAFHQRRKLYCPNCHTSHVQNIGEVDKLTLTALIALATTVVSIVLMLIFAIYGAKNKAPNSIVVAVIMLLIAVASTVLAFSCKTKLKKNFHQDMSLQHVKDALSPQLVTMDCCDATQTIAVCKLLLLIYPYNVYQDFGIAHLTEWVDPEKKDKPSKN